MQIRSIKLTNFKNYCSEQISFNSKYNAVVGYNGMGKTNLLDAVYFTCMTKSNFTNVDRNLIKKGEAIMRTEAVLEGKKVVCKFDKSKKKIFQVNGKVYTKMSDHIGRFPVVFIVPSDQNLLLDGSKERRKLLDNSISQIDVEYLTHLITYNSLLQQRNAYLKMTAKSGGFSEEMLMTYTEQMREPCEFIHEKRQEFITEFESVFRRKYAIISGAQEEASCTYKSQLDESEYATLARETLEKDRVLARTNVGIHKDDLIFRMDEKPVKYFASQGQTKSFILSLKLAQFKILGQEKGVTPILLLDDLFDKLDHKRVQQLIELLEAEEVGQVFISDTDTERVVSILKRMNVPYKKIVIDHGKQVEHEDASEEE